MWKVAEPGVCEWVRVFSDPGRHLVLPLDQLLLCGTKMAAQRNAIDPIAFPPAPIDKCPLMTAADER